MCSLFFFFNDTATTEIYTLSLHDALPILARKEMPRLFTRFGRIVTLENGAIPGVGLGLYLCRELAHMHGGELTASSEAGRGSTFRLRLPLARGTRHCA